MKYAIFSDVHSNFEALTTVLKFYETKFYNEINFYLTCGDIVGYGPDPDECVETLKYLKNCCSILGNHDAAVINKKSIEWFNPNAKDAILWTKSIVKDETLVYLNSLSPMYKFNENIILAHGSPREPVDEYLTSVWECLSNMSHFTERICFVGHTHIPFIFELFPDNKYNFFQVIIEENEFRYRLDKNARYIINIGSVGQPRDSDPRSCCTVYDDKKDEITFYRLEYDIKSVQEKMVKYNLPKFLITRLAFGR